MRVKFVVLENVFVFLCVYSYLFIISILIFLFNRELHKFLQIIFDDSKCMVIV